MGLVYGKDYYVRVRGVWQGLRQVVMGNCGSGDGLIKVGVQ